MAAAEPGADAVRRHQGADARHILEGLTDRLRQLEASRLIDRDYRPTIPPSVTYTLTPRASELGEVLSGLSRIAKKWAAEDAIGGEAPRDATAKPMRSRAVPAPAPIGNATTDALSARQADADRLSVPASLNDTGEQT